MILLDDELLGFRVRLDAELARRGMNFSVGEIGEKVAIEYFNSTPGLANLMAAPTGAKNVDALSRDGDRYSIKTQMKAKKSGTIYSGSENQDKQLFEYLLIVKLSPDYQLETLHRFHGRDFYRPEHGTRGSMLGMFRSVINDLVWLNNYFDNQYW